MTKIGRPRKEIDSDQLEKLMGFRPSLFDVSGFFKCSREHIIKHIRAEYDMTFKEFRSTFMSNRKLALIQVAMGKAEKGDNEMIKFCLVNLAGWTNGYNQRNDFEDEDYVEVLEWEE